MAILFRPFSRLSAAAARICRRGVDQVALDLPGRKGLGYVFRGNPAVLTVKDGVPLGGGW